MGREEVLSSKSSSLANWKRDRDVLASVLESSPPGPSIRAAICNEAAAEESAVGRPDIDPKDIPANPAVRSGTV